MAAPQQTGNSGPRLWTICLVLLLLGTFVQTAQADARHTDNPLAAQVTGTSPATEASQATATPPSPTAGTGAATIDATATDTSSGTPASPTATNQPPTDTSVPTSTPVPPTVTDLPTMTAIATSSVIAPTTTPGTLSPSTTATVPITGTAGPSPTVEPPTGTPLRLTASATAVTVTPLPSDTALPTGVVTTIGIETLVPSVTAVPIVTLPVIIESDNPVIQRTGQWTVQDSAQASGGNYVYSSGGPGDSLTLNFQGDALDVLYVKHPALGSFAVEIDGKPVLTVIATAPISNFGARAELRNLAAGPHIARIYPVSGTVAIDAFAIELPVVEVGDPTGTATVLPSATPTSQPSLTATATFSATVTITPVPPSPTATSTPTKLPVSRLTGQVSGLVSLLPARITVIGGRSQQTVTAQADGSFSLELPPGSYQITVAALYHLPSIGEVVMADQPVTMPAITLIAGDVNGDGAIDAKDAQLIADNFGRTVPPAPLAVDVNGDGIINIYDLAILSANMKPH